MRDKDYRVVFMGSPEFSVQIMKAIAAYFNLVGIVTQPDRPTGRGKKVQPSPVKQYSEQLQIPLIAPMRLRSDREAKNILREWQPDVIVVAAYGQILKADVLNLPRFGCINVHTSLLPRWRGASPIESAILNGDTVSGVTIMQMDEGMDTGPILAQSKVAIRDDWRAVDLEAELAQVGASLLVSTLPKFFTGEIAPIPQPSEGITYAPMLKKQDGVIDPSMPLAKILQQIRAYYPWPGTFINFQGQSLKILEASGKIVAGIQPGLRDVLDGLPALSCLDGWLLCKEVHPAGKNPMTGEQFIRGYRQLWLEETLT